VREFQFRPIGCSDARCLGGLPHLLVYERPPHSQRPSLLRDWYAWVLRPRSGSSFAIGSSPLEALDRRPLSVVAQRALGLLIPLGVIVGYTLARGYHALLPSSSSQDQRHVGPLSPATEAVLGRIIGSLEMSARDVVVGAAGSSTARLPSPISAVRLAPPCGFSSTREVRSRRASAKVVHLRRVHPRACTTADGFAAALSARGLTADVTRTA